MKAKIILILLFAAVAAFSCTENQRQSNENTVAENTLKSVSLFLDTVSVDAQELKKSAERINAAIDSIGYPDAGYRIWEVVSSDSLNFKFMVEGYWPDQATYDTIHQHHLYQDIVQKEEALWQGLQQNWYYRFESIAEN